MLKDWKRFAMAAVFVAVSSAQLAGCDLSPIIANMIASIATGGNGCGSCGGCAGCGSCAGCSCDCSSCNGCDCSACGDCACALQPITDNSGRNQGFNWAHNNARIANSVQVRLSQSGLSYINSQIPSLVSSVLPAGGADLASAGGNGTIYIEMRNPSLTGLQAASCSNSPVVGHKDCIRLTIGIYARTCDRTGGCTAGENVAITVNNIPILGSLTCQLNVDLGRGTFQTLPLLADVAIPAETRGPRTSYSHPMLLDAQITNTNALEGGDVIVNCPNQTGLSPITAAALAIGGAVAQGVSVSCSCSCSGAACLGCPFNNWWNCSIDPSGLVSSTINNLRGDLNNIVDYQTTKMVQFCQYAAQDLDCPTGTHYDSASHQCWIQSSVQGGCPSGTQAQGGYCWFVKAGGSVNNQADRIRPYCMDMLLGVEGRMDIGSAEAVVTPGIEAIIDLLVAALGDSQVPNDPMNPGTSAGGYNINIAGGLENIAAGLRSLPHNPCVPLETPPPLPNIPLMDRVRGNTYPNFAGDTEQEYEIGVGVAEAFVHYAAWKLWDAGAMCLHVGGWLDPQLGVNLLAPLVFPNSGGRFLFPLSPGGDAERTYLALSLRPQKAPITTMEMVPDPQQAGDMMFRVGVDLNDLEIDFSFFTQDRYVRVGTAHTDLHIDIDLDLDDNAQGTTDLRIALSTIDFIGSEWTSAPLIEPADAVPGSPGVPSSIEQALDGVAATAASAVGGLLPRLNFEDLINMNLNIPGSGPLPFLIDIREDSLQVFSQAGNCSGAPYDSGNPGDPGCEYPYAGVFINLVDNPNVPGPLTGTVDTQVRVTRVSIPDDHTAFQRETLGQGPLPTVEIAMSATGPQGAVFEYSYRTSYGGWTEWSRSPYAVISDRSLVLQTKQTVFARARVAGEPRSMDTTSATDTFTIDVTAPTIEVSQGANGNAQLQAVDWVSAPNEMQFRVREPGDDWSAWRSLGTAVKDLGSIDPASEVEVRDGEGNVASNVQSLRGRPNPNSTSSCGSCAAVGNTKNDSPLAALGTLAVLGLVIARRRRRA